MKIKNISKYKVPVNISLKKEYMIDGQKSKSLSIPVKSKKGYVEIEDAAYSEDWIKRYEKKRMIAVSGYKNPKKSVAVETKKTPENSKSTNTNQKEDSGKNKYNHNKKENKK